MNNTLVIEDAQIAAVEQELRIRRIAENQPSLGSPVEFVSAMDVKPKAVEWQWKGILPKGYLTILGGKAGEGKSTLTLYIAAVISKGGIFPDGSKAKKGRVLILSYEDDPECILVPRLTAMGANLANIVFVRPDAKVLLADGQLTQFKLSEDMEKLESSIINRGPFELVIIDPIIFAVEGDMNSANNVRQYLHPLIEMAKNQNFALLGITHTTKGSGGRDPQERILGSQAFSAAGRMTLLLAKDIRTGIRRLVIGKTNITDSNIGYDWTLEYLADEDGIEKPVITFIQQLEGNAKELLADVESDGEESELVRDAMEFLKGILHDSPLTVKQVKAEADGAGYSWSTIRRAADRLKVDKRKEKGVRYGQYLWTYPPAD